MPADIKLNDYGRLLKDGELKIKDHTTQKISSRYCFVFSQAMFMCKAKVRKFTTLIGLQINVFYLQQDQYRFRDSIHLNEYKVEEGSSRKVLQGGARWSFQWFLTHKKEQNAFTLYARTMDDRNKWMKALRDAM
jgi:guanine nucleotide exchange factor VAV